MRMRILAVLMALVMTFSVCASPVYATAGTATAVLGTSAMASAEVSAVLSSVATAAPPVLAVVGIVGATILAANGIKWVAEKSAPAVESIGSYIMSNLETAGEGLRQFVASVVSAPGDLSAYKNIELSQMAGKDMLDMLVPTAGMEMVATNASMCLQTTIPDSLLYSLPQSYAKTISAAYYNFFDGAGVTEPNAQIYLLPETAKYLLVYGSEGNYSGQVYNADGSKFNAITPYLNYNFGEWMFYQTGSTGVGSCRGKTINDVVGAFGGLVVSIVSQAYAPTTFIPGRPLSVDRPWGLERGEEKPLVVPGVGGLTISNDRVRAEADVKTGVLSEGAVQGELTDSPAVSDTGTAGILGFLEKILAGILSIPKAIVQGIVDALKGFLDMLIEALKALCSWLFVPTEGFLEGWLESVMQSIESRTGILTYPLSLLLTYLARIAKIGDMDAVLTIPEVRWQGSVLIHKQTFNFDEYLAQNTALATFYGYYMVVARAMLIFAVLRLALRKGEEMMEG